MRNNKRTHVGRRKLPRRSVVRGRSREKSSRRATSSSSAVVVVSSSVHASVSTRMASTRVSRSHARVASQRDITPSTFHPRRLVPRTHGTVSVLSAHPRSNHLFPPECSFRGRTERRNGARDGGGVDCIDYLVGRDENVCRVAQNELGKLNIGGSDVRKIQTDGTTNRHKRKQRKCSAVWRCPILSTGVNLAPRWISQPRPVTL